MSKRAVPVLAAATTAAVILTSCATGAGPSNDQDVEYDSAATLSGDVTVMGFGAGDEIGMTRYDLALEALGGDVEVELIEGDLDIQQFLSAVASGEPPGARLRRP